MGLSTVDAFKHIRSEEALTLTDAQRKALQRTLNGMLSDLDECFIPWDDDVDVNMPRADLEKFLVLFEKEYGDRYWVHSPQTTKGYGLTLSRILLKGTSVRTREDFQNEECGAFLDIFPIENTYDNKLLRRLHGLSCMAAGFAQSCSKFKRDRKELLRLASSIEDPGQNRTGLSFFLALSGRLDKAVRPRVQTLHRFEFRICDDALRARPFLPGAV